MSDEATHRSWWKDVLLVVLGAALAITGSVIAGLMAQSSDRESFLREQRLTQYSALLTEMTELETRFDGLVVANTANDWDDLPSPLQEQRALDTDALSDLQSAYSRVQVVGSSQAVQLAENAVDYYVTYASFMASQLAKIAEDRESGSASQTDYFYDGGAEFMSASAECLGPLAREPFVAAVQRDIGLESPDITGSSLCSSIDWESLYPAFVDALAAGSFASPSEEGDR